MRNQKRQAQALFGVAEWILLGRAKSASERVAGLETERLGVR